MVSLRPQFLCALVCQVRSSVLAKIPMKSRGAPRGFKRQQKPLMRSLLLVASLLFGLITAKAQPVSYAFNNGLGKAWRIATWKAADSKIGLNQGAYVPENVDFVDGMLRLKVEQTEGPDGIISKGAAVWSRERFGYGTYEFVMRMASDSSTPYGPGKVHSGTVSSAFLYFQNS